MMLERFLFLTIFVSFAFPKAGTKIEGIPITLGSLLLAFLFTFWLIEKLLKNKWEIVGHYPKLHGPFLVYIIVVLGLWFIKFPQNLMGDLQFALPIMVPLVIYYAVYPVTYDLIKNETHLAQIGKIIITANIVVGVYGLMQYFFGHYNVMIPGLTISYADAQIADVFAQKSNAWLGLLKVTSTFQNGNIFGVYLAMTTPIVMALYLTAPTVLWKFWAGSASFLAITNLPFSLARSGLFGASMALLALGLMRRKGKDWLFGVVLYLYMLAIIFLKPLFFDRLIMNFFDPGLGGRVENFEQIQSAINGTVQAAPWWDKIAVKVFGLSLAAKELPFTTFWEFASENIYLTFYWWFGLLGVALFLFIIAPPVLKLIKASHRPKSIYDPTIGLAHGITAGLIGYFVMAMLEGALWMPPTGMNLWFLLALASALVSIITHSLVPRELDFSNLTNNKKEEEK